MSNSLDSQKLSIVTLLLLLFTLFWILLTNFRYVLESEHVKKFFDYIQLPNFDIAADAAATFKVQTFSTPTPPLKTYYCTHNARAKFYLVSNAQSSLICNKYLHLLSPYMIF